MKNTRTTLCRAERALAVYDLLLEGPAHRADIHKAVGGSRSGLAALLASMRDAGLVEQTGDGVWRAREGGRPRTRAQIMRRGLRYESVAAGLSDARALTQAGFMRRHGPGRVEVSRIGRPPKR